MKFIGLSRSAVRGSACRGALGAVLLLGLGLAATDAAAGPVRFTGEGHAYHPMWSLDGKYVAFEVNRYAGDIDLFVSEVNGAIANPGTKVTLPGGSNPFGGSGQVVVNPIWHPQGVAVFEGSNQGGQFRLYYHQPGGGAAAEMISTTDLPGNLTFPAVAPDGTSLAFISNATGNGDIRTRDTATGKLGKVGDTTPGAEMFPQFDATGKKVLFTRKHNNTEDVFEVPVIGGAATAVAGGGGDQTRPTYAADGRILYFDSGRGEDSWDLVTIDGPGGTKKTLAKDVRLPLRARPAISPNGKWVAYTHNDPALAQKVMLSTVDGARTVEVPTDFTACGEPAIGMQGGRVLLAYTALPSKGADWRFLYVEDLTDRL